MSTQTAKGISDDEVRSLAKQIKDRTIALRDFVRDKAALIGAMSHVQLKLFKAALKGIMRAEHIDRLAEFGKGKLPAFIGLPEKSISPAIWRPMVKNGKISEIDDPDKKVALVTPTGVKRKSLGEMNPT